MDVREKELEKVEFSELAVMLKISNRLNISHLTAPKFHRFLKHISKLGYVDLRSDGKYYTKNSYVFVNGSREIIFNCDRKYTPQKRKSLNLGIAEKTLGDKFAEALSMNIMEEINNQIIQQMAIPSAIIKKGKK